MTSCNTELSAQAMANALRQDKRYRVLELFEGFPELDALEVPLSAGVAAVVDTETTGLTAQDRIIELGVVVFAYDRSTAEVLGVLSSYVGLEDPGMPISPEASAVHGITDEMVRGKRLDEARIVDLVSSVDFVLAHNADFDRSMCERRLSVFKDVQWACSLRQVPWAELGVSSAKLEFIAYRMNFFYEAHRADMDCHALLKALSVPVPLAEGQRLVTGLNELLQRYNQPSRRIWALASPFDTKDALRARGYRWSDGQVPGSEKAWWKEVPLLEFEQELAWLKAEVYRGRPVAVSVDDVDAYNRFSERRVLPRRVTL